MTSLNTLVEPLKRELAVPGLFDEVFPSTTDDDLAASLADGFADAQLRGFFPTMTVAETGGIYETSEPLSASGGALITLFTATRIIRAQLRSLASVERYKAGPVEYELQRSANLLRDELAYLKDTLDALIKEAQQQTRASSVQAVVIDGYKARNLEQLVGRGGFMPYELIG